MFHIFAVITFFSNLNLNTFEKFQTNEKMDFDVRIALWYIFGCIRYYTSS